MKDRIILHSDLNNFFASVSLLSNATLTDCPVAVCGSVEERHGIVLAKNYIAKEYGVKTGEAVFEARLKCNDLIILPPDYKKYKEYSLKAKEIYSRFTDIIEPFGIDECWLDVTGSTLLFGSGEEIAQKIRKTVKRELGITVSIGVSFNKVFAKLGSDMKKPDAVTVISKDNFKDKIWHLPVSDLLFVGNHTCDKLNRIGIFTIGDLASGDERVLKKIFGKNGVCLKNYANGLDFSPVTPVTDDYIPKSVGRSTTPKSDIKTYETVWKIYIGLAEEIAKELQAKNLCATGISVNIRDKYLKKNEASKKLDFPINRSMALAKSAMDLFCEICPLETPLRSIGFRAINLKDDTCLNVQRDVFGECETEEKEEIIEYSVSALRERFGKESIKRGRILEKTT